MDNKKNVIKGLEDSLTNQCCGYMDGVGKLYAVSGEDLQNAIALIKEQKGIIESLESDLAETLDVVANRGNVVRCKDCVFPKNGICHNAKTFGAIVKDDWFCADGIWKE